MAMSIHSAKFIVHLLQACILLGAGDVKGEKNSHLADIRQDQHTNK
jgi:hypothetical protein